MPDDSPSPGIVAATGLEGEKVRRLEGEEVRSEAEG
jgi:hypothetical protein